MNALGIYFGPKIISIVETKGRRLINNIQISQLAILSGDLEEKVPEEVKMVAFFKDELRRNKIEAKEAALILSGKDLIIRTFEMPIMPHAELKSAVNFEAKKYLPFKVEDLISDFQVELDKPNRRNLILFVGIKKETLEKYLSIASQLDLQLASIEYSGFSILRLLKLAPLSDKGIIGLISVDFQEEEEVNFTVLENGFPLFSRDINLMFGPEEVGENREKEPGVVLEKLKTEIRVSLDYYHRKFPTKEIKKIFFISDRAHRSDLETSTNEIGLSTQFIDVARFISKPVAFSLSFLKAYSGSLAKIIKANLKINLLSAKIRAAEEISMPMKPASLITDLRIESRVVILGLLICLATFIFGKYRMLLFQRELNSIIGMRPQVFTVNPKAGYEELANIDSEYKRKIDTLDNLIKKQLYLTEPLNIIPLTIPKGVLLNSLSFNKKEQDMSDLILEGVAYLADSDKEFALVTKFLSNLKENSEFSKYFKEIDISYLDRGQFDNLTATKFSIYCRTY